MKGINKKTYWMIAYIGVLLIGCGCRMYTKKPEIPPKYFNYVFPHYDYKKASVWGDTLKYEKVVKERRTKTPSHPDYLDLSILMAGDNGYTPGYYYAYLAIHDLYKYNHFRMGDKVQRLMYSYLQLAIEHKDKRITQEDLKGFYSAFPDGKAIVEK